MLGSFQDAWHRPALHEFGNSLFAASADQKWDMLKTMYCCSLSLSPQNVSQLMNLSQRIRQYK
ncbi:hypothetical protein CFP56_002581 [Quercus suber]|uniref:Uncharacterized protein n=1 Tax=Quercus suber TaxID=58331 RepID=A0AAW0IK43_QUESU